MKFKNELQGLAGLACVTCFAIAFIKICVWLYVSIPGGVLVLAGAVFLVVYLVAEFWGW